MAGMKRAGISLSNPLFFIPNNEAIDNSPIFAVPIPSKWTELRGNEWVNIAPIDGVIQRQGWKVHISSTLSESREVLKVVSEVCYAMGITFKHLWLLCQESGHKSTNKFDFQFKLLNLIF